MLAAVRMLVARRTATISVVELPPRLSARRRVSLWLRYGTSWGGPPRRAFFERVCITSHSAVSAELIARVSCEMLCASCTP